MAAASSHRSPSPAPERRSPNHRTQETICSSIRRSLNGNLPARPSMSSVPRAYNPVTPANSPADFPRRNSISKEAVLTVRASYEKENESDRNLSKHLRMKSPVASTGTKNFMAPTISAASKVTPSPRKKVLTERNETVRTSLTSPCEGKSLFPCTNSSEFKEDKETGSKLDMGLDSQVLSDIPKPLKASLHPRSVDFESNEHMDASSLPVLPSPEMGGQSLPSQDPETNYLSLFPCTNSSEFKEDKEMGSKRGMGLDSQALSDTPKPLKASFHPRSVDFESNEHMDASSLPVLSSPETGGQSLPPYDPETNYLSPRPMFLHYKPNPRIKVYLNREKDFDPGEDEKSLEGSSFASTCSDDTESTEETQSLNTQKDSGGSFSLESGDEVHAEISAESDDDEEEEQIPRSRFFPKLKSFLSFLFILAIVCVSASVIDSPGLVPSSLIENHQFDKTCASAFQVLEHPFLRDLIAEISEIADGNLERGANHIRRLSIKCLAHVFNVLSLPREAYASPFEFGNLTADASGVRDNKVVAETNQIRDVGDSVRKENALNQETEEEFGLAAYAEHVEREEKMDNKTTAISNEEEEVDSPAESEVCGLENEEPISLMHEEQTPSISLAPTTEPALMETDETKEKLHTDSQADINLVGEEISGNANSPTGIDTDYASHRVAEDEFLKTPKPIIDPASRETDETPEKFDIDSQADIDLVGEEISGNTNSQTGFQTPQSPETYSVSHGAAEDGLQMQKTTLAISLTVIGLVVAVVLSRSKAEKLESVEMPEIHNASIAKEMDSDSVSASSDNGPFFDRTPLNGPSEVDVAGNLDQHDVSSSLQMSSSGTGGPQGSEKRGEVKVQSYQRRGRRSSSSYSYSESHSYGSFTTYEKLPSKQGLGDDEAMTPVRRSSRLRKPIITSP